MVNLRDIAFNEDVFREAYNEWMAGERPILQVDQIGNFAICDQIVIRNIQLDFDTNLLSCLEIGCANGSLLFGLMKLGIVRQCKGIDISSLMIDYAKQTMSDSGIGIDFENISIENYNTTDKYDIIFAFELLEHLSQPVAILDKINALLKPGGFFYGVIPDGHTCDADVHINWYTMDQLYKLLLKSFKRITIIPVNLYENRNDHFPEIHLFFRCQRSADA